MPDHPLPARGRQLPCCSNSINTSLLACIYIVLCLATRSTPPTCHVTVVHVGGKERGWDDSNLAMAPSTPASAPVSPMVAASVLVAVMRAPCPPCPPQAARLPCTNHAGRMPANCCTSTHMHVLHAVCRGGEKVSACVRAHASMRESVLGAR